MFDHLIKEDLIHNIVFVNLNEIKNNLIFYIFVVLRYENILIDIFISIKNGKIRIIFLQN